MHSPGCDGGWVEHIFAARQKTCGMQRRFLRQAGALLCLLERLRGGDVHYENLLMDKSGSALAIDLECLLSPVSRGAEHRRRGQRWENVSPAESLGRVTLLPWSGSGVSGRDVSSLGDRVRTMEDLRILLDGYEQGYRQLLACRRSWLSKNGRLDECRSLPARVVLRSTLAYQQILDEMDETPNPRKAEENARNHLEEAPPDQPNSPSLIDAEIASLRAGDIPRFTTFADSRELRLGTRRWPHFWGCSGVDAVRQQLESMNEADLRRQLTTISDCWKGRSWWKKTS